MNPTQETNAPQSNTPTPMPAPANRKPIGPIMAIMVIILALVIGGMYLYASYLGKQQSPIEQNNIDTNYGGMMSQENNTANAPEVAPINNSSDDPQALQDDLNQATNGLDGQNF